MKYTGPVSFFFEGDKGQALLRQLIARKQIQETVDLVGGIPGTRGFRREYPDGTVIITAVEVGETWVAPKAVVYVPVRKQKTPRKIIVIPFEVYVAGSAFRNGNTSVIGTTHVYVAEFTDSGQFVRQVDLGELTGVLPAYADKYAVCGPYIVAGSDPKNPITAGTFSFGGYASARTHGAQNRYSGEFTGNLYREGKAIGPLPGIVSGLVQVAGGLVAIKGVSGGALVWSKKVGGEWVDYSLSHGLAVAAWTQAVQFVIDEEGYATGIGYVGDSAIELKTKGEIVLRVSPEAEVSIQSAVPFYQEWSVNAATTEITELEVNLTYSLPGYPPQTTFDTRRTLATATFKCAPSDTRYNVSTILDHPGTVITTWAPHVYDGEDDRGYSISTSVFRGGYAATMSAVYDSARSVSEDMSVEVSGWSVSWVYVLSDGQSIPTWQGPTETPAVSGSTVLYPSMCGIGTPVLLSEGYYGPGMPWQPDVPYAGEYPSFFIAKNGVSPGELATNSYKFLSKETPYRAAFASDKNVKKAATTQINEPATTSGFSGSFDYRAESGGSEKIVGGVVFSDGSIVWAEVEHGVGDGNCIHSVFKQSVGQSGHDYFYDFGYIGDFALGPKNGKLTRKQTLTYTYTGPKTSLRLGETDSTSVYVEKTDWQTLYLFEADPEYNFGVGYLYTNDSIFGGNASYQGTVAMLAEEPSVLATLSYGSNVLERTFTDEGRVMAAAYLPLEEAEYGCSTLAQGLSLDCYSLYGFADGRIYSLPESILNLALVSGGWWMGDAGGQAPAGFTSKVLFKSSDDDEINQTRANSIQSYFDTNFAGKDLRFLGLSMFQQTFEVN